MLIGGIQLFKFELVFEKLLKCHTATYIMGHSVFIAKFLVKFTFTVDIRSVNFSTFTCVV